MSDQYKAFSVIEQDYEPIELFSDLTTIEGIATYFKLYSNITGNKKIKVVIDNNKFKPNKKYVFSKDTRKVPTSIQSGNKYFVVTRSSKAYNIYTFDDVNFLNGIYIGVGLCKEDYKYIIRGFGSTHSVSENKYVCEGNVCKIVKQNDGVLIERPEDKIEIRREFDDLATQIAILDKEREKESPPEEEPSVAKKEEENDIPHVEIVGGLTKLEKVEKTTEEQSVLPITQRTYGLDGVKVESGNDNENENENDEEEIQPIIKRNLVVRKSPSRRSPRRMSPRKNNFEQMKLDDLKKYADKEGINIKGLTKKSDIVSALNRKK